MGKCCVAGAGDCLVDQDKKELRVKGHTFKQGDWISLDGTTGRVIAGKLKTLDAQPDDPDLVTFMAWSIRFAVSRFAPTPTSRDARMLASSEQRASASAAPSICSLPRIASSICAP